MGGQGKWNHWPGQPASLGAGAAGELGPRGSTQRHRAHLPLGPGLQAQSMFPPEQDQDTKDSSLLSPCLSVPHSCPPARHSGSAPPLSPLCPAGPERLSSPPCSLWGRAGQERPLFLPEWMPVSRAKVRAAASLGPAVLGSHQWRRGANHSLKASGHPEGARRGHSGLSVEAPQGSSLLTPQLLAHQRRRPILHPKCPSNPGHTPDVHRGSWFASRCFKQKADHGCLSLRQALSGAPSP